MRGGDTNYGAALSLALDVAQRQHNNNFELYHFIMMSDGIANYPEKQVNEIKNSIIF